MPSTASITLAPVTVHPQLHLEGTGTSATRDEGEPLTAAPSAIDRETLDEVLAVAAHELRAPLTSFLGFSLRLATVARARPDEAMGWHRDELGELVAAAERMQRTIRLFLDARRLDDESLSMPEAEVDLTALIDHEVQSLLSRYPHVECHRRVDAGWFRSSEAPLRSILGNLLENAARYGGEWPVITVEATEHDGALQISVRDSGPGIPIELQERIFDRYYHTGGGTGLGLFVARAMAERMDGQLSVESAPGIGSSFTLTLPPRQSSPGSDGLDDRDRALSAWAPEAGVQSSDSHVPGEAQPSPVLM